MGTAAHPCALACISLPQHTAQFATSQLRSIIHTCPIFAAKGHPTSTVTRLLESSDANELTELLINNRDFLGPWEPLRDDEFFTAAKQSEITHTALTAYAAGSMVPFIIFNGDGNIAGRLNINGIVRGAFQSAALGYWVGQSENGAGLATAAVADAVEYAATELKLHRLQAETLLHNERSQRVLEKNGFTRYGLAPDYLKIAGEWQEHILFQKILSNQASGTA